MSGHNPQDQPHHPPQPEQHSNVRHIPIFVEGRDEPVINRSVDHGTHFADPKPAYVPPPQPHIDREQYFADDGPVGFPFSKNFFRQSPQPFTKQKMYPQTYARGGSPQRSQSPKPQSYHEQSAARAETPSRSQQKQAPPQQKQTPPQQKQPSPQQKQPSPQQRQTTPQPATSPQAPHHEQAPPQQPAAQQQAPANDSLKQILTIQADVLNLITEVENFKGTKNDKHYLFLDEMLTRNLIKLDNIETDGKESIRQGRKEVIKCINDCIAMLEKKAESRALTTPPPQDVEMQNTVTETPAVEEQAVQNGDVEMKETTKDKETVQPQETKQLQEGVTLPQVPLETEMKEDQTPQETKLEETQPIDSTEAAPSHVTDKQLEETKTTEQTEVLPEPPASQEVTDKKQTTKKTGKKRDKSKDKKDVVAKTSEKDEVVNKQEAKDCKDNVGKIELKESVVNKQENENKNDNVDNKEEVMQVDAKGDTTKPDSQSMEVDVTASQ